MEYKKITQTVLPNHNCTAVGGRLSDLLPRISIAELNHKHIIITGGTGFFGYWLLSLFDILSRRGFSIRVTVLSRSPEKFIARAPTFSACGWLRWLKGDVLAFPELGPADLMIHAATDTSAEAHRKPLKIMDDILLGTRLALDRALSSGIQRILYISSGAVYGAQPPYLRELPESANIACDAMALNSAYGEAKRAAEQWCVQFGHQNNISIPVARCFSFVGAGLPLSGHFAIGNFIRDALKGLPIQVNGNGTPLRSYLYGADLALWLIQILTNGQHARAYNVGSNQATSIIDLAKTVRNTLAPQSKILINSNSTTETLRNQYVPAIQRAKEELGLDAWTSLEEAIRLTALATHPQSL